MIYWKNKALTSVKFYHTDGMLNKNICYSWVGCGLNFKSVMRISKLPPCLGKLLLISPPPVPKRNIAVGVLAPKCFEVLKGYGQFKIMLFRKLTHSYYKSNTWIYYTGKIRIFFPPCSVRCGVFLNRIACIISVTVSLSSHLVCVDVGLLYRKWGVEGV